MDLIIPPQSEAALALLEDDLTAAQDYLAQEKAEGTRAAYRADFKIFSRYCDARGLSPMPASPEAVMAFISAEVRGGAKASTVGRRIAAILYAHRRRATSRPPTRRP